MEGEFQDKGQLDQELEEWLSPRGSHFSKAMAAKISRLKKTHIQAYIRTRNTTTV